MKSLLSIALQLLFITTFGQKVQINGLIVDEHGDHITGASVQVYKSLNGTNAYKKGAFSLVANIGDSLQFTHVGYSWFGYRLKAGGNIVIQLKENPAVVDAIYSDKIHFNPQLLLSGFLVSEQLNKAVIIKKVVQTSDSVEDEIRVFTKVEIPALLTWDIRHGLDDSVIYHGLDDFTRLTINFRVTKDGNIDSVTISGHTDQKLADQLIKNLKTKFRGWPAEQNGRRIATSCILQLILQPSDRWGRVSGSIIGRYKE